MDRSYITFDNFDMAKYKEYKDFLENLKENGNYEIYQVTSIYENRLDLISYKLYGDIKYYKIIADFNDIVDIFNEIYIGTYLKIPTFSKIKSLI